ncbi:ABC transporter substrate-binding protein [uncultured Nisaea sp.]|uniref:ABC transporter substrate-binding protein n=1 Tax=uncultured Nisaea sp. TaxID=538215 RepID=UPI0030EB7C74|tara:strand:+ start:3125 stop:4147 length:1023 start_codon:yes stop_codon:yes gene_type:complete
MKHLFTRRAVMAGLTALGVIAGTIGTAAAADKITVGALRFTSHAGGFVAFEKGYFAEQGLEVEFKFFQAAQPMAVAIASGDVDFGVTSITGGLVNLADKGAVKVIGGVLQEEKGIDGSAILVSTAAYEAGLTSPDKLAGHSLGITQTGSSFHYMASQVAAKEGFDISKISLKPLQKVGAIIGALKSSQIDAMIIVPHIAKPLSKSGAAKIIGWIGDYDDYQVTTAFTSAKNAAARPELVKKFVAAYARGAADFNAVMVDKAKGDPAIEEMTRLIHKYVYTSRPFEKAAPSIKNGAMRLQPGLKLNLTNVKKQLAWFQSEGLVGKDISIDTLVDTQFVETY